MASRQDSSTDYHTKRQIATRLTEDGHALISALAKKLGVGKGDVIELGLRELAKREGVRIK